MYLSPYAIPALAALTAKAVIFFYARTAAQRTIETRLYLYFLFTLSVQNLAEIFSFAGYVERNVFVYYSASIVAIALLLHLALVMGADWHAKAGSRLLGRVLLYLPGVVLECLLWFTDYLITGVRPFNYTYSRIPGPLYFFFEIYAIGCLIAVAALLLRGSIKHPNPIKRSRNRIILAGITPPVLLVITVVTMQHFGTFQFNATITLPIAVTFFLAVTAYATHRNRLFDIAFYIPWSKVRARKTALYSSIRTMISGLTNLGSAQDVARGLSYTLGCSVALVNTNKPVLAMAGDAQQMVTFPLRQLHNIDHMVVANEIAETSPDTYKLMHEHGVAAIVPFRSYGHSTSGWMLLGEPFSDLVYSSLDFRIIKQLFDRMAKLFNDKLLLMHNQLTEVMQLLESSESRLLELKAIAAVLQNERNELMQKNTRLFREQSGSNLQVLAQSAEFHEQTLKERVMAFEKAVIMQALNLVEGNKTKAARLLGLRPNTLHYKLERYNMAPNNESQPDNNTPDI